MQNLRRRSRRRRILPLNFSRERLPTLILKAALISVIGAFLLGFVAFVYFSRDLPAPGQIKRSSGFSTTFYDRDGKVLFEMFEDKNRIPVTIKDIPQNLKDATVAIED
jgi:penicillin-binding protein 1A